MARAIWNATVVAEGTDIVLVEGNVYFRAQDVDARFLQPSETHTICGWKGVASYHHVVAGGQTSRDGAWYYPDPKPEAERVRGRIAFWHGVKVER